jgi:hypothetical protein
MAARLTAAIVVILAAACAAPFPSTALLLPPAASSRLTDLGAPPGGLPVIGDLAVFDNRLWLAQSRVPLAVNGAALWTFEPSAGFVRVLDDPFSQGFVRADVIDGRLYVADGDPRGFAPGIVHVFTSAAAPAVTTSVDEAIHNFQVVKFGDALYVTGGLADGSWGLNRYDAATQRWAVAQRGSHLRLKYATEFAGSLYGIVFAQNGAELVEIDPSLQSTDLSLVPGQGIGLNLEVYRDRLYMTGLAADGSAWAFSVGADGSPPRALQGLAGPVFDFVEHDGRLYAVGCDAKASYVYASDDGETFMRVMVVDDLRFGFAPGSGGSANADGRPSLASFNGKLYLGSSTNGHLYRLD